jgi:hypothetical protein
MLYAALGRAIEKIASPEVVAYSKIKCLNEPVI